MNANTTQPQTIVRRKPPGQPTRHRQALMRLFKIVTLMQSGSGLGQQEMAAACGCTDRHIRRYLNALKDAGIQFSYTRKGGYQLDSEHSPFKLELTLQETIALLLARQSLVGREHMPFSHSASTAFEKVARVMPEKLSAQLKYDTVTFLGGARRDYSEVPFGAVSRAIQAQNTIRIKYYTPGRDEITDRSIDPYHIVWPGDYMQLIAYCHLRLGMRHFAMDRVSDVRETGEKFTVPRDFNVRSYLANVTGPMIGPPVSIKVRFAKEAAYYAGQRIWDFEHEIESQPDGSMILTGTVRGLDEIRKELLSWGRFAIALEPQELRAALLAQARAMVEAHSEQ